MKNYPTQLQRDDHFKCPIWFADEPAFVNSLNKASDKSVSYTHLTLPTNREV